MRFVDPHWKEWHNFSAGFKPNHNHVNAAPKRASLHTTSRPHHHAAPKHNYYMLNVLVSIPICEIKKEWLCHQILIKKTFQRYLESGLILCQPLLV
jgi:hypothetical protein